MKLHPWLVTRQELAWPIARRLTPAFVAFALICVVPGCAGDQRSVVLAMSWKRGDDHYGPNSIHLESPCLGNSAPGCFCSADFKGTTSKDFADYIESFGSTKVQVKYRVDYDRNHQVVGALLQSVGVWTGKRFHDNERSLGTGFRMIPGQSKGGGYVRNPGDCFPSSAN